MEIGAQGEVKFYDDGNLKKTLDWDDAEAKGLDQAVINKAKENKFGNTYAQAENTNTNGDIPGTPGDPCEFDNLQWLEDGDQQWSTMIFTKAEDNTDIKDSYTCNGNKIVEFENGRKIIYSNGTAEIFEQY